MKATGRGAPTDSTREDLIRRAVGRVLAGGPAGDDAAVAHTPRRAEMFRLVEALTAALDGEEIPPVQSATGDALWLLRSLRTEVVATWPEDVPLLPVMRAFEETQRRLLGQRAESPIEEILTPFARSLLREVAHMIRSPLGSIVMMADTLLEQGERLAPERRARQHAIIYRAALGLSQVGGELLTLVDAGEVEPADTVDVREALELVADVSRPVTEARDSELAVMVSDDAAEVVSHPQTLTRALLALTLRAALRSRDGRVELEARRDAPDRVEFSVTASGSGTLPDGGIAELLELFRAEPDTGSYTLSPEGLGLAAAAHLVRAMGSELTVDAPAEDALRLAFGITEPTTGARAPSES